MVAAELRLNPRTLRRQLVRMLRTGEVAETALVARWLAAYHSAMEYAARQVYDWNARPTRPIEPTDQRCRHGCFVGYSEMPSCCISRAAVSDHWSAELRAKVAASAERERNRVQVDLQDEP